MAAVAPAAESLERWLERERRYAASAMLRSISPAGIVKTRPGFGQTVRGAAGAVVASPVLGDYDPEPDYFFHWLRDSAVVMDALRLLFDAGLAPAAPAHLADFVRFSLRLQNLDGRALIAAPAWRDRVAGEFRQFLREDDELAGVHGDAVAGEARVNADGTLDISKWGRPQNDGPPLRALALMRWSAVPRVLPAEAVALIRADLAFTVRRARQPSYDLWEEELGAHYYTLRVSAAALEAGAAWLEARGDAAAAPACRAEAQAILRELDGFWIEREGHYRARASKGLDVSTILAALHAGARSGPHSPADPRMHATFARLEALFGAAYPVNAGRAAPAMGRYAGDVYFTGGPWYLATLGAAEFCFRAGCLERGDAYLETVRAFTPPGGELSEQFDPRTGAQVSAQHLAWSYAAFITCVDARRAAIAAEAAPIRDVRAARATRPR